MAQENNERTIKINFVRMLNSKTQAYANISISDVDNGTPFDYFISLAKNDESEIHKYIRSKIDAKEIEILPPIVPQSEFDAIQIRDRRNHLLAQTDKYMTIDYPISEEKRTELRAYRQALRELPQQKNFPSDITWPEIPKDINIKDITNI